MLAQFQRHESQIAPAISVHPIEEEVHGFKIPSFMKDEHPNPPKIKIPSFREFFPLQEPRLEHSDPVMLQNKPIVKPLPHKEIGFECK